VTKGSTLLGKERRRERKNMKKFRKRGYSLSEPGRNVETYVQNRACLSAHAEGRGKFRKEGAQTRDGYPFRRVDIRSEQRTKREVKITGKRKQRNDCFRSSKDAKRREGCSMRSSQHRSAKKKVDARDGQERSPGAGTTACLPSSAKEEGKNSGFLRVDRLDCN